MTLTEHIAAWAGELRRGTFVRAAEFILQYRLTNLIETGSYRGTPADGMSTLILASLAKETGGHLNSFELDPEHEAKARHDLFATRPELLPHWTFIAGDSIVTLAKQGPIQFAYLDSFDHDPNNFMPCQRHQLAEVGAILGKMTPPCAILMDDNVMPHGGKVRLSVDFLRERGWDTIAEDYQVLMVKT